MKTETYERAGRTATITRHATGHTAQGINGAGGLCIGVRGDREECEDFVSAWLAGDAPTLYRCGTCGEVLSAWELVISGSCDGCGRPIGDEDYGTADAERDEDLLTEDFSRWEF